VEKEENEKTQEKEKKDETKIQVNHIRRKLQKLVYSLPPNMLWKPTTILASNTNVNLNRSFIL
jgi:hypothetical protein